ncbi:MAG TPA: imelysin family protein [Paracoccaceae bacterium]|nr:imelysin family protein [Paracoccaceae bacterium]
MAIASPALAADEQAVLDTYMDIAQAGYADSLATASTMAEAIDRLIAEPSEKALDEARDAWRAARVPYQQTEVYRFGNPIVDEWEGKVNAWPLDEGLIDYVDYGGATDVNPYGAMNIIASPVLEMSGREIDASAITPELIRDLHELDGIEANVTSGYHAIEFLLWGQDLSGTGEGSGARPATDFDTANCTHGNCDRRAEYLQAATDLLLSDLEWMAKAWAPGGAARQELEAKGTDGGIITILTGMGSLSYGEQAGERMKLGLLLNDPEEEHDCFSDNTHNSHFYDGLGIRNVYLGRYVRANGEVIEGPSVSDLVAEIDPEVDARLRDSLDDTIMALTAIKTVAEAGTAYDQLLAPGNAAGGALIQAAIDALVAQTREIERAVAALELQPIAFEGSDSLDNPSAVFQ